ncbi:hypothetical protein GUJ93_ZPchr0001g29630 [Zizania palustris]|uniref:RING-type E3 ubiquitin transferase n=1 Tax=Zizania palustris TaxID=103762 RepID=A0A8J5RFC9_ZIZPA|nr:hypothetical protein GUJ93_ZPchr0001g29630 [Zizania palustris]KAG8052632.1 hypothetical protein GUJ93_ZPchr0001g29630 [Zizania palustris]
MAEETAAGGRYWCHMCAVVVSAVAAEGEVEIKCPYCHSGFLEEMETAHSAANASGDGTDSGAGSAISIWGPILDSMVADPVRRRRNRRHADDSTDDYREMNRVEFSRRRRRATTFLRLLQAIRERQLQRLESDAGGGAGGSFDIEHYSPFGRSLFAAGPGGEQGMALGDYFLGPGLDALMQQLAESDASRQGTPPTKKEAVDAMPTVEVTGDSAAACAVCLEDYAAGEGAREMPCRHRFHAKCIVPWLEMHSSCPICRFQLPADDDHKGACGSGTHNNGNDTVSADDGGAGTESNVAAAAEHDGRGVDAGGNASRLPVSIQWLNSLFSQTGPSLSSAPASTSGSSSQHCDD